jgi:hypothetical protein
MPYKSKAQAAYFNIHRKELEREGVDVDEWNESTRGKKLPDHVKKEKKAGLFNGRQIPDAVLAAIRRGDYSLLSRMGSNGNKVKARQNAFPRMNSLPANTPNPREITPEQLSLGLPVRKPASPYDRSGYIHNDSHAGMILPSAQDIALWRNNPYIK